MTSMRCPTCGATIGMPKAEPAFPFCSSRCKLADLGRWLSNEYVLDPETGKLETIDPELAVEIDLDGEPEDG